MEGNNDNTDWWKWEQTPGMISDGSKSGLACDHYRRYEEDLDLAAGMSNNAHRLSVEWARLEGRRPRHAGSNEKWRLTQPCAGMSSADWGRSAP